VETLEWEALEGWIAPAILVDRPTSVVLRPWPATTNYQGGKENEVINAAKDGLPSNFITPPPHAMERRLGHAHEGDHGLGTEPPLCCFTVADFTLGAPPPSVL
jgi:hypothetical protein